MYVGSIVMARDGVGARLIRTTTTPFPFGSGVQQLPFDGDLPGDRWATFCRKSKGSLGLRGYLARHGFLAPHNRLDLKGVSNSAIEGGDKNRGPVGDLIGVMDRRPRQPDGHEASIYHDALIPFWKPVINSSVDCRC